MDFQSLSTGAFERLIRDSSKNGKFNPQVFYNNWRTLSQKNKDLLDELYDLDEQKLINEFVDEVSRTFKPTDLLNSSSTASAFSRLMQADGSPYGGNIDSQAVGKYGGGYAFGSGNA